ncbi:hypothetical protein [Paludifilum halophilum]|uniref:hypothetical protein n=1 Tax=Paludifilum halophilum TaxID=1642702 RepID=UPI00146F1BA9|nr:hypothetical protein [Paludifilum halophilum]
MLRIRPLERLIQWGAFFMPDWNRSGYELDLPDKSYLPLTVGLGRLTIHAQDQVAG